MPKYRVLKYRYDKDDGNTVVRTRRIFLDDNGDDLTPPSSLFNNKVINTNEVIVNPHEARKLVFDVPNSNNISGYSKLSVPLPYDPSTSNLLTDVRENNNIIQAKHNQRICISYFGENRVL